LLTDTSKLVAEGKPILDVSVSNSARRSGSTTISGQLGVLHPSFGFIASHLEPEAVVWNRHNHESAESIGRSFAKRTFGHTPGSEVDLRIRDLLK
jgi:hypothetical protein